MADRMTPAWEKQGNAAWVSCPSCEKWFPVDPQLITERRVELVCPACAHAFLPQKDE